MNSVGPRDRVKPHHANQQSLNQEECMCDTIDLNSDPGAGKYKAMGN